jgi:hypothetical protein
MTEASDNVPEVGVIASLSHYYKGINYLYKDKSAPAAAELKQVGKELSEEFKIKELLTSAEMGATFDKGDYKGFLAVSKKALESDTTLASSWAGVSSAYACLYAKNGADSLKNLSLYNLKKSQTLDDTSAAAKEYAGRIMYRLDSRKIITKEQFYKQFPKGYTSK